MKVEYLGRIEYDFQKSRVTVPWDHKDSVSAKKVLKKFHACVPLTQNKNLINDNTVTYLAVRQVTFDISIHSCVLLCRSSSVAIILLSRCAWGSPSPSSSSDSACTSSVGGSTASAATLLTGRSALVLFSTLSETDNRQGSTASYTHLGDTSNFKDVKVFVSVPGKNYSRVSSPCSKYNYKNNAVGMGGGGSICNRCMRPDPNKEIPTQMPANRRMQH